MGSRARKAVPESLVEATQRSVAKAREDGRLTDADTGAVEAMLALARKIDAWDVIVQWAIEDAQECEGRPKVPQNDTVSISAYLKYAESLGLTPAGRAKLDDTKKPEGAGGTLGRLRAVHGQSA